MEQFRMFGCGYRLFSNKTLVSERLLLKLGLSHTPLQRTVLNPRYGHWTDDEDSVMILLVKKIKLHFSQIDTGQGLVSSMFFFSYSFFKI